jgi:diguanylate cyclase
MLDFIHLPTLFLAVILVIITAAGMMSFVGVTQRTYQGYWWWVAAQWLKLGSAIALYYSQEWPALMPLTILLTLQWPTTMLTGLRRFYVRSDLPCPEAFDRGIVMAGTLAWTLCWVLAPEDLNLRIIVYIIASIACYGYAGWMIHNIRERKQSRLLQTLVAFMAGGFFIQIFHLHEIWNDPPSGLIDTGLVAEHVYVLIIMMCAVIFAAYMGMLLTYERTEQDLRESQRQLRTLVELDMLTQLPHRRHFIELAQQSIRLSPPHANTMMLMEIAGFKQISENYGHAAAESALVLVSRAAKHLLRSRDIVGRLEGDQFIALLPDTSVTDAVQVSERMRNHLVEKQKHSQRKQIEVNIALMRLSDQTPISDAMRQLTEALSGSEPQGHGRVIQVNPHQP